MHNGAHLHTFSCPQTGLYSFCSSIWCHISDTGSRPIGSSTSGEDPIPNELKMFCMELINPADSRRFTFIISLWVGSTKNLHLFITNSLWNFIQIFWSNLIILGTRSQRYRNRSRAVHGGIKFLSRMSWMNEELFVQIASRIKRPLFNERRVISYYTFSR